MRMTELSPAAILAVTSSAVEVQAETVIFRRLAGGALGFAHLLQPLGRAETAEGMALVEQFLARRAGTCPCGRIWR